MIPLLGRAARTWWLRAAISAAVLAYLLSRIDAAASARAMAGVGLPALALVLGLVALDRAVMIRRFVLLLGAADLGVRPGAAARLFLVSSFVGSFLPAGVGADAARAWGLARQTARGSDALAAVLVDRLLGVVSLAALAALGLLVWTPPGGRDWRLAAAAAVLLAASAAALWADRAARALLPPHWHDSRAGRRLLRLCDAVGLYRGHRRALARVLGWSLTVQGLRVAQAYGLAYGLGLGVPFSYYLLVMPVGLLMLMLPVSVSGVGLPQGVIVWLLRPVGVPDEQSFALSTLIVLTGVAGNLPGLFLWLRRRQDG